MWYVLEVGVEVFKKDREKEEEMWEVLEDEMLVVEVVNVLVKEVENNDE